MFTLLEEAHAGFFQTKHATELCQAIYFFVEIFLPNAYTVYSSELQFSTV